MRLILLILLSIDIECLPDNEISKKCFIIYCPKKRMRLRNKIEEKKKGNIRDQENTEDKE